MSKLTGKQRSHLRGLAHHLNPVVQVGARGVTDALLAKIRLELENHELIKVKVLEASLLEAKEAGPDIAEKSASMLVQVIGRMVVLYREREEEPEIRLPRA